MPILGDVFINTVYSENISGSAKVTEHPVEVGFDITDHIDAEPEQMTISGVLVGADASLRLNKLKNYKKGELLRYSYRNVFQNVVITSFNRVHDADVKGGLKFTMTLKEVRIAKPVIIKDLTKKEDSKVATTTNKGLQQPKGQTPVKSYAVKSGDTLSKIAAKYGVTVSKLHEKNRGVIGGNPNLIFPGQNLIIP